MEAKEGTDVDGPDPLDIFSDEPGTLVVGDAEAMGSKLSRSLFMA